MAVLQKRETEIPLNGGMDTSAGAEYQSVSTMRAVTDLRWNNVGELEKRPATASTQAIVNPGSLGVYAELGGAGLVESRGEVYAITDNYGAMNSSGRYIGGGGSDVSLGQVPFSYELTPKLCQVSRKYIDRCSGNDYEQGFQSFASCVYNDTTLVTAAVVYINAASGCILRLQALNIDTGAVLAQMQFSPDVAASTSWAVDACANNDVTTPGAIITFASGNASPFSLRKFRYRAATQDFIDDGLLGSTLATVKHRTVASPTTGHYLFAWDYTSTGFIEVREFPAATNIATRTHAGLHVCGGGIDMVVSGTSICIVSMGSGAAASVYAERFETPATYITVATLGATETAYNITAARETSSNVDARTVIFVSMADVPGGVVPSWIKTRPLLVDFSATTCTTVSAAGSAIPNVWPVARAVTVDNRAYVLLIPGFNKAENPTPAWCRYDQLYSTGGGVIRPVARVCHDVTAFTATALGSSPNLWSASVVGSSIYATLITDFSVDEMPNPGTNVGQKVALSRVDLSSYPATYAQKDGVSVVAGGLPFELDGDLPTITQPYCRPVVVLDIASAGTTDAATGIDVIAIYRWIDAAGRLHRSAPSASVSTGIFTNKQLDVYVSQMPFEPFTNTGPSRMYSVEVYVTADGGAVYYLANTAGGDQHTAYSSGEGYWKFSDVLAGVVGNAAIYSTGDAVDELVSEAPPAFAAICTVGDRMWAIDAEDRSRIWPSKPFVAGLAVEWNTANCVYIGDLGVGISDVGGIPTVFCERGVWQVYGGGPNALGVGTFDPARRLPHEVACLDARSVCKTPVGVAFRARQGVMLLDHGLALQNIGRSIDAFSISGALDGYSKFAYDELSDELHVVADINYSSSHYVFNLGEGKWAKWSQDSDFQNWKDCVCVAGRMWFLNNGTTDSICRAKAIDESNHNAHTYGWSIETPWIRFDGVTGNMRIWEIIAQLRTGSSNGADLGGDLSITYETRDFAAELFNEWTSAELLALAGSGNPGVVHNLRCRVTGQRTRQFRMTIGEGTSSYAYAGHVPIALRVLYGITSGGERKKNQGQNKGSTVGS